MVIDISLVVNILTLIVEIVALVLSFRSNHEERNGPTISEKSNVIEGEVNIKVRFKLHRPNGKKNSHPVCQQDENDRKV